MRIDVYQDTVCPWCRIGKKNLQLALAQWGGDAEIHYHTFFLNPDVPTEGYDFREYLSAKMGIQPRQLSQVFDGPTRMGAAVGLEFNFDQIERSPNSLLSHRLIALAPAEQREAVIDALYDAYFRDGRDIGDLDTLIAIATETGLDGEALRARLLTDETQAEVEAEAEHAHELGITGVPFFILNQKYAFSGAQPPERIVRVLQQASQGG